MRHDKLNTDFFGLFVAYFRKLNCVAVPVTRVIDQICYISVMKIIIIIIIILEKNSFKLRFWSMV